MIDLKGHSALVTGSTSGVGRAIAEAFAQAGADVVVHGHEQTPDVEQIISRVQSLGRTSGFFAADLSAADEKIIEQVFQQTIALLPRCDILVNNAGAFFDVPFEQMTFERFEKTIRLNVQAGYFLTQRFANHWIASNIRGRALFTGSINGRLAEPNSTAYDISKGAVEMMVKTLAVALAPKGIRVNGLAPGLVQSNATAWLDSRPDKKRWMELHTPNGQVPSAEVCGPAAVYLCSDAAEHVHGHMLLVDGGMSAWQQPNPPEK
jgi:NAD(P)-dependent dehydrogenase (short-subunit alcohol dehydrogenase family)